MMQVDDYAEKRLHECLQRAEESITEAKRQAAANSPNDRDAQYPYRVGYLESALQGLISEVRIYALHDYESVEVPDAG